MTHSSNEAAEMLAAVEPRSALLIGGILGAMTFLLCALLCGARTAIAIAAAATLVALVRRVPSAAILFAISLALSAAGLLPSTYSLTGAAAAFGIGLAMFARTRMRSRIDDAMSVRSNASNTAPIASA